ncbi:hypothetical protein MFUL124B02_26880 [Myxococcus fulvus 124B02]|nr:hypothetical protein MFUL124B02_26880 [Myxococcus fulvus 124B02]
MFLTFLSPEYYETLERHRPSADYLDLVKPHLDAGWKVIPGGYWTRCWPREGHLAHGWKIHLAASNETAVELLQRTLPLLTQARVSFKFCADPAILRLSLNKNAPRTGAGKFVTIYPENEEHFLSLAESLHQATEGLWGPFLLTDRPYKGSKVVFYRYGTHLAEARLNLRGERVPGMTGPDGSWMDDHRKPHFFLPRWAKDPLSGWRIREQAPSSGDVRLNQRYRIERALKFNASGGIYQALDTKTGQTVILREARPLTSGSPERDEGFILLEKEARILQRLESTGYTPRFVELFKHWEHLFLVQEKIEAESLWGYAIGFSRGSSDLRPRDFFSRVRDTMTQLATALKVIHARGIVMRDLTRNNILFTSERRLRFIDLEFAFELDGDTPFTRSWTDGHSSPQQRRWERPAPSDDWYTLGAILIDQIAFLAPGLDLNREGTLRSFRQTLEDYHLPLKLHELALGLLEPDASRRWDLDRVLAVLGDIPEPTHDTPIVPIGGTTPPAPPPAPTLDVELDLTLAGIERFIVSKTDDTRDDRLWPDRGGSFSTNPLNLEFGAAGIAAFLHRRPGGVPTAAVEWMKRQLPRHRCPPGLFQGLAGTALVLQELGCTEQARAAMDEAASSSLLHQEFDLFWGDSGWGLANLHFWRRTGEEQYLTRALEVAEFLQRTKQESSQGVCWSSPTETPLGLFHGQSGPALFLTYLSLARPKEGFLELAVKALDFEVAHCQYSGDVLLWYPHTAAGNGQPKSPHMRHGTAGVGSALLRAYVATGEPRLLRLADQCANTVRDRHTNKLWLNYGLSGYGEFLVDMHRLLGDERYLHWACFLSEAIMAHRIQKEEGIAFPADSLLRISCDLGGGMAGIGLFLHRLRNPREPHFLFNDELLGLNAIRGQSTP